MRAGVSVLDLVMKAFYRPSWGLLGGAILWLDHENGDLVSLAPLLFFPAFLAAWFNGRVWGLALAIAMPLGGLGFHFVGATQATPAEATINAAVQIATFSLFAILIDLVANQRKEIRVLKGVVPTCAWCKKVRREDDIWQQIEAYITERTDAKFTHTICSDCAKIHFVEPANRHGMTFDGSSLHRR